MNSCLLALALSTVCHKIVRAEDTYSVAVVEYSPVIDPSLDPGTNILNHVSNYVDFINLANDNYLVDMIVFPECGLRGYGNQRIALEIPDPAQKVVLCGQNSEYEAPLIQLSCAARAAGTYVVVNLEEKSFDYNLQKVFYFNTDVVFDANGAVVVRYRKIHTFVEDGLSASVDKSLVYFDTDFGVRFGIFTCFDIIFKTPGVELAQKYNVSHFIFPTAWYSELPFLTGIQEQSFWAYTQNVVLLASGYNLPSIGSSGTGIYLGRQGPAEYAMTETRGSFILHAILPKTVPPSGSSSERHSFAAKNTNHYKFEKEDHNDVNMGPQLLSSTSKLVMKRDFLEVYATKLLEIPVDTERQFNGSDVLLTFDVNSQLCHNTICCNFSLTVTAVFSEKLRNSTRGDDYSQMYYRLAAFDGVRTYDHVATGGLQTCAIISCVSYDLSSCGLRSDDPSARINTMLDFYQTEFIFENITITGNFSNNDSFVGPNVLVEGKGVNFGAILDPEDYVFITSNVTDTTATKTFRTVKPVMDLVTASLYGRLFFKDGQPYTGSQEESSSAFDLCINILLIFASFFMIKYSR